MQWKSVKTGEKLCHVRYNFLDTSVVCVLMMSGFNMNAM